MHARMVKGIARLFLPKHNLEKKLKQKNFVSEPAQIPRTVLRNFIIDEYDICGRKVYCISPKNESCGKSILFLHGGAYINNIFRQHFQFAGKIATLTGCRVIIPDYPLAPSASYSDAYIMLTAVYASLLRETANESIIFMGDSAGGGLALAFAQYLSQNKTPLPSQLILLCPWLDVSMTNPEIQSILKKDPILRTPGLVIAGKVWAGSCDTKNPMISPIYGDLANLPHISMFIGTYDILYADCNKLSTKLQSCNVHTRMFVFPKMFHDWMLYPNLREADAAINIIQGLITQGPRYDTESK